MTGSALLELVASSEVLVVGGAGGVGKTTTAAALGLVGAVDLGRSVLVITVDPARRLAGAMGLGALTNDPLDVSIDHLQSLSEGRPPIGKLAASMLDMKASWDEMILRCAPDAATAKSIMENPIYGSISSRFVQSHDYIAIENLFELHRSGHYDLIVVDTPPSRNAIDFLEAPRRMEEFFSSRLLRWLTLPRRSRLVSSAFRPFYTVAERVLGSRFLGDLSDFFLSFQSLHGGFVERARAVTALLGAPSTSFLVVTAAEEAPTTEAIYLAHELTSRSLALGGIIVNRTLPDELVTLRSKALGHAIADDPAPYAREALELLRPGSSDSEVPSGVTELGSDQQIMTRVLVEVANCYDAMAVMKERERIQCGRLSTFEDRIFRAPQLEAEVASLEVLLMLGRALVLAE
ncbi:MAG: ArsA family ATPase [Acidimicrobiales bacterium]